MKTDDIYIKVGRKMALDGFDTISAEEPLDTKTKKAIIESMSNAILSYSYEKISRLENPPMDLSIIFDVIDTCLPEGEQETFYANYVHCMLYVYGNIEDENILWSIIEEKEEGVEYPRIVKEGEYLTFYETEQTTSPRESAEWLYNHLTNKYNCKTNAKNPK